MLVNRRTWTVKPGHMNAIVDVLKTGGDHIPSTPAFRVYQSRIGAINRVVLELDFEDLAHYERYWAEFGAAPESAQVDERLHQHCEAEGTNEIWRLR